MSAGEFLECVYDRAGDALRAAGWYDTGDVDLLYVRPDLDRATAREGVRSVDPTGRPGTPVDGDGQPPGSAIIRPGDGRVTVVVPTTERAGAFLSLESLDPSLREFVHERAGSLGDAAPSRRGGDDGKSERCPHCGSRNYVVRSSRPGRPREAEERYRCRYCGESFESPVLAESRLEVKDDE